MLSLDHSSGAERRVETMESVAGDIYVNFAGGGHSYGLKISKFSSLECN